MYLKISTVSSTELKVDVLKGADSENEKFLSFEG